MMNLSGELRNVLGDLAGTFRRVEETPESFGTGKAIIMECFPTGGTLWVNVIPEGVPGECHPTLIVAIGSNDSSTILRNRLLEAVKHVGVSKCKGITRLVVFYAMWWDAKAWSRERGTFQQLGVPCVLMMPYTEPQQLR